MIWPIVVSIILIGIGGYIGYLNSKFYWDDYDDDPYF